MTASRLYVGSIFLSLILRGCIPLPYPEKEPYSDDVNNLKVGSTTKNDILGQFGEPGATYSSNSVFVYTDFQSEVVLLGFGGAVGALGEQHFLVLSFDEDGVLSDHFIKSGDSDSHGCIDAGWCSGALNRVLRLSNAEQDARAKQFSAASDQCGIYVYGHFGWLFTVSLDGKDMGGVFSKRYFQNWEIDPGIHEIVISPQPGVNAWGWGKNPSLSISCAEGEILFIEFKNLWSRSLEQERDDAEGREQIKDRRLILSGPMRKIPYS